MHIVQHFRFWILGIFYFAKFCRFIFIYISTNIKIFILNLFFSIVVKYILNTFNFFFYFEAIVLEMLLNNLICLKDFYYFQKNIQFCRPYFSITFNFIKNFHSIQLFRFLIPGIFYAILLFYHHLHSYQYDLYFYLQLILLDCRQIYVECLPIFQVLRP